MAKTPDGFVPLTLLKGERKSPRAILEEIRTLYFRTTRQTIEHDFAHAIELLKRLESEEDREKATVYMHGLAEMRREWMGKKAKGAGKGKRRR